MIPDETTAWQLTYDDRFDRESTPSVDKTGVGITAGLMVLWRTTLHEGIDADGRRTFSVFSLTWHEGFASIPIDVVDPDATLAKLRAWAFPVQPSRASAGIQSGAPLLLPWPPLGLDACPTAPHGVNVAFLGELVRLHLRHVCVDERDAFYHAAAQVLRLCKPLTSPAGLALVK